MIDTTVATLTARGLLGGKRSLLLLALPVVLLALAAVARASLGAAGTAGTASSGAASLVLGGFALGTVVPLLALIAGTGSIGPEIDDGSIVYLLAKPISRLSIVTSKLAVSAGVVLALGAVPTLLAGLVLVGGSSRLALGYALGVAAAGLAYVSLFTLLAVVSRSAVVIGLVYALVWESVVGQFVPGARALSVQQWSLSFTQLVLGDRAPELGVDAAVGWQVALALLLVVVLGGTFTAVQRLRSIRLTSDA